MTSRKPYYVTTPIYYVNDRPHVGHCYTTMVADCLARFMRMAGRDVFFLTGTDEHAEKVVTAAAENGMSPQEWADRNAAAFKEAFELIESSHDDFIRTTEDRHTSRVRAYIEALMDSGDVYLGDYEGWYDPSQEEYVTENTAREHDFKSPVTGRDLIKRSEKNYFFRLSAYSDRLNRHIEENPGFIRPESRRNEVLGRIKGGLQDVPISRAIREGDAAWGILMPGDETHRVYVWIDALFNYISTVDTPDRVRFWPAQMHYLAKDILWFHAVIWPAMLMALGRPLPGCVYAHSYWVREGRKMSKSLGNFIDLPTIRAYCDAFGVEALRWYILTQGPLGSTDADFAHEKFVDIYNSDLANGIGNAASRVTNMIGKYFDGKCPDAGGAGEYDGTNWIEITERHTAAAITHMEAGDVGAALAEGLAISNEVDAFIHRTEPFKLARDEARMGDVATILYCCAEALRISANLLSPAMPRKMCDLVGRLGGGEAKGGSMEAVCAWGQLRPGSTITKGEALFPRADTDAPAPVAQPAGSTA